MPQKKKDKKLPDAESKNPPTTKDGKAYAKKGAKETAPVSKIEEQPKCHIHDKVFPEWVAGIRENVCVNDEPLTEFENKHYCLFHMPTKDKNVEIFKEKFQKRLKTVDEALAAIDQLPEAEREKAKREISCDFRYVWFPSSVDLNNYKFSAAAYFSSATFSADAYFRSATFSADAYFRSATFSASAYFSMATFSAAAYFSEATFSAAAYFRSATFSAAASFSEATFSAAASFSEATFSAAAYFSEATFSADAYFSKATFSADAYFSEATFSADAYFSSAKFLETSQTYFNQLRFCSFVNFYQTEFEGYVEFEGDVFLDNAQVLEVREELATMFVELAKNLAERGISFNAPTDFIKNDQEAFLSLVKARLKNPERISFNSMSLRPSWFVNTDARMYVFNDVDWRNIEIDVDRKRLDSEFENLTKRDVDRPRDSLIKACNQLADNAEANRRFEEAKQFRKQGIALRKRECHVHDSLDPTLKSDINENVCRDFPVVNEVGGNYFCLWHNPDKKKAAVFLEQFEIQQANEHCDYRGVVFPIAVEYTGDYVPADNKFNWEKKTLPDFLDFSFATFQGDVYFEHVRFGMLRFFKSSFESDSELTFSDVTCTRQLDFTKAIIDGKLFVNGGENYEFFSDHDNAISLQDARVAKPQSINFRSVRLRPHYFVGVEASKFEFHDCVWTEDDGGELDIEKEIEICSHKELAQTANELAINYEENRNFEESTTFRYMAMQAKRFEYRFHGWFYTLNWFYWWSSGYGERRFRAFVNLLAVFVVFAALYASPLASFDYGEKPVEYSADPVENQILSFAAYGERFHSMEFLEALAHSGLVATFQRPEPKPAGGLTKFFIFLETVFVPLQAALLALAIRRKFMR